jgi:hypothetical protein
MRDQPGNDARRFRQAHRWLQSAVKVAAIERLVRSDRRQAATTDIWNIDPGLLNTLGGIVDFAHRHDA